MAADQEDAPEIRPSLRLAELLCARLCRELDGLVDRLSPAHEVADLHARLELAQTAWGHGDGIRDMATLRRLAMEQISRGGTGIELVAEDGPIPVKMGQVLLNLLMVARVCLPCGGTINLGHPAPSEFVLLLDGPAAAWPPGFAGWITNPIAAWRALDDARAFQAPLSVLIAADRGCRLSLLMGSGQGAPPLLVSRPHGAAGSPP